MNRAQLVEEARALWPDEVVALGEERTIDLILLVEARRITHQQLDLRRYRGKRWETVRKSLEATRLAIDASLAQIEQEVTSCHSAR